MILRPLSMLPDTCTRHPPMPWKMSRGRAGQSQESQALPPRLQSVRLARISEGMSARGSHSPVQQMMKQASVHAGFRRLAQQHALAMRCSSDAAHVQQATAAVIDLSQHNHGHVFAHGLLYGAHVIQQLEPVLPSQHLCQALQMPAEPLYLRAIADAGLPGVGPATWGVVGC